MIRVVLIAAAIALQAAAALAAPREPLVTLSLSTAEAPLGTAFYAYLEVSLEEGGEVSLPSPLDLGPGLEELARKHTLSRRGDLDLHTFELKLMAFELGDLEIPELPVVYATADGAREARTSASRVSVVGELGQKAAELREVVPVPIIRTDLERVYWAGGIVAGVLLLAMLLPLVARAARRMKRPPVVVVESALATARRRFEALERDGAIDGVDRRAAYVSMSEIVREYLESAFQVSALDATTAEIAAELDGSKVDEASASDLVEWLRECDLVKFAGFRASADDARAALYRARGWIEREDERLRSNAEVARG